MPMVLLLWLFGQWSRYGDIVHTFVSILLVFASKRLVEIYVIMRVDQILIIFQFTKFKHCWFIFCNLYDINLHSSGH